MKQKSISILSWVSICLVSIAVFYSCKKTDPLTVPPELATFTNETGGTYFITAPGVTYDIPIGVTTVADQDRTITFNVTSPTGATAGTYYTLPSTSVVIPKGETIGHIVLTGVYNQYTAGRKDTLIFTLVTPNVTPSDYNNTFTLLMRGPCFEGDVNLDEFLGTYTRTIETFGANPAYGPYTTTITSATSTGATTGTIVVNNLWDNGWEPISFNLDWTNPAARTATVISQAAIGGSNGGDLNGAYEGITMQVRPFTGNPGTFSICSQTLTLRMQLGVTGLGFFGSLYTVNMAR